MEGQSSAYASGSTQPHRTPAVLGQALEPVTRPWETVNPANNYQHIWENRDLKEPKRLQLSSRVKTAGRGPARARQVKVTPLGKQSVPDSAQCLSGGTSASPLRPPAGRGAGSLKADHWALQVLGPARPARAGGSSGAVGGAASGRSSSRTRCSCRVARPCGCAGAAPGQMGG